MKKFSNSVKSVNSALLALNVIASLVLAAVYQPTGEYNIPLAAALIVSSVFWFLLGLCVVGHLRNQELMIDALHRLSPPAPVEEEETINAPVDPERKGYGAFQS